MIIILRKGLSEEVVRKISELKGEPDWMLEFRLKAYINKDGKRTIPLFTDEEDIRSIKLNTTVGSIFMRDLFKTITPIKDSFDQIVINPKNENSFKISIDEFLGLFDEEKEFEDLMKEIENDKEFQEMLKQDN